LISSSSKGGESLTVGKGELGLTDVHDSKFVLSEGGGFLIDIRSEFVIHQIVADDNERKKKAKKGSGAATCGFKLSTVEVAESGHDGYDLSSIAFSSTNSIATGDSFGGVCVRR